MLSEEQETNYKGGIYQWKFDNVLILFRQIR